MDLEESRQVLKNILVSELDQKSKNNRLWTRKLALVSKADALLAAKTAKAIVSTLSSRSLVLKVPVESIALYNEAQLQKMGIVPLRVPGLYQYYAMKEVPDRLLFRKKKAKKEVSQNAALVVDLKTQWLEVLPFECRFLEGRLVLRGAEFLERLRSAAEHDILRIINLDEWKKADKKERAKLDYCSITAFDRILVVDLLRKNWLALTPKCKYFFQSHDAEVREASPKFVHHFIFAVSKRNRYRFFPSKAKKQVQGWIPKD